MYVCMKTNLAYQLKQRKSQQMHLWAQQPRPETSLGPEA